MRSAGAWVGIERSGLHLFASNGGEMRTNYKIKDLCGINRFNLWRDGVC